MDTASRESRLRLAVVSLALVLGGCGEVGRAYGPPGVGEDDFDDEEPTVSEIQDGFDRVLSEAAAYVGDDSKWVLPAEPEGGDEVPDTGDDNGEGSDSGAGATCQGYCGELGSDQSCYCDGECEANGDCCGDYAQHCGAADPDDGSGGDDGSGSAAGTCLGFCGGPGSDGLCYCDADCEANGDCCSDIATECTGDDAPTSATCEGFCDGQGSDGSCYCDDTCSNNGDCCDDFATACGVGSVAADPLSLAAALGPQAGVADACWAVLAGPIDVSRVAELAGATGLAAGGTCVAIAVVPAGATAGPTLGLSVGAAALACGTVALDGVVVGAVGSILEQKLPSIAQCSDEIIESVVRVFPWGKGVSEVRVKVYNQSPGNCEPDRHSFLQNQVNTTCKNAGWRRCTAANLCEALGSKMQLAAQCIEAREQVNSECFGGGDKGHKDAIQQEKNLHANCLELSTNLAC